MQPGVRDFTSLYMKVEVDPPAAKEKSKSIRITYLFDPETITFATGADGKRTAIIDYEAVCYDLRGQMKKSEVGTLAVALTTDEYNQVLHSGLQAVQTIAPGAGNYRLRLGAIDRTSRHIGTVEVPITVP
jgi:hypothetical protein